MASAPVLSLRTWYCGSSFDARTVRTAASVSDVISRSTVPVTVVPWLRHSTLSPFRNFLSANSLRPPDRGCPGRGFSSRVPASRPLNTSGVEMFSRQGNPRYGGRGEGKDLRDTGSARRIEDTRDVPVDEAGARQWL